MFKIRGKIGYNDRLTDVENPRYNLKTPSLRLRNFFSKKNFDTGFEISSVGTPEISPYTKFHQYRTINDEIDFFEGGEVRKINENVTNTIPK